MLYRIHDVIQITTLSKTTIYRLIKEGSFPKPIRISRMRVGWREGDIQSFVSACSTK